MTSTDTPKTRKDAGNLLQRPKKDVKGCTHTGKTHRLIRSTQWNLRVRCECGHGYWLPRAAAYSVTLTVGD